MKRRAALLLMSLACACSDVWGIRPGKLPPSSCSASEECAPGQTCRAGLCVSTPCRPGELRCNALDRELCDGQGEWTSVETCDAQCRAGECVISRSCDLDTLCGAERASCCAAFEVPAGRFTLRDESAEPGTVAADGVERAVSKFAMDRFEVTYGRFRRFVDAYVPDALPGDREGAVAGEPDSGWHSEWNGNREFMPNSRRSLELSLLACGQPVDNATLDDLQRPVGCVNWYLAFAFCIWDQGRLPTEAEWAFAAEGGDEQRAYPWSTSEDTSPVSADQAFYSDRDVVRTVPDLVGLRPGGAGKYGHVDLAGNVWEWVADWHHAALRKGPCRNGAGVTSSIADGALDCVDVEVASAKVQRGGSYVNLAEQLRNQRRSAARPRTQAPNYGFRCVRTSR